MAFGDDKPYLMKYSPSLLSHTINDVDRLLNGRIPLEDKYLKSN